MSTPDIAARVEAIRRFNRFYTRRIGVLNEKLLRSPFSLTEARVIFELAHRERATATSLSNDLGLDTGYLSRILRGLEKRGLIQKLPCPTDGRQILLSPTEEGRAAFAKINAASENEITAMLTDIPEERQGRLIEAMRAIEEILCAASEQKVPYILRFPEPGDMGWVIHRHGVLYAREYGWDEQFEALVADIVVKFMHDNDPKKERCWIVEREGENVGSVFLVRQSDTEAKLRLLLVEPKARGLGIGSRLVQECVRFAKHAGYQKLTLWTNDVLHAARHIYEKTGFHLVGQEPHRRFGRDAVGETWELNT